MKQRPASNRERPQRQQLDRGRDDLRQARIRAALAAAGYSLETHQIAGVTFPRMITRS